MVKKARKAWFKRHFVTLRRVNGAGAQPGVGNAPATDQSSLRDDPLALMDSAVRGAHFVAVGMVGFRGRAPLPCGLEEWYGHELEGRASRCDAMSDGGARGATAP